MKKLLLASGAALLVTIIAVTLDGVPWQNEPLDAQIRPGPGAPIDNFNFKVEIDGVSHGFFLECSGLDSETEVVEFRDGQDDRLVRKIPGRVKFGDVTLKRGYAGNDVFYKWYENIVDGKIERKAVSIVMYDEEDKEVLRYQLLDAWPCKWKGFSAVGGAVLPVEEMCLTADRIRRVEAER